MNKIYIRGNEIATKEYVDSLSFNGGGEGPASCVIHQISAPEGETVINYDRDIRSNMQSEEVKYFYLNNALIVSEEEDQVIFSKGEIIKVSTNISGGDASTTDSICSDNNAYEVSFVIFGDGTKSYSVNKMEYLETWELEYADIDWDQITNKPFGEIIPQDDVYILDYDTRTFKEEVVIEGEIYYYKYELTEEEQALFHNIGTAEGTLRLYADGDEVEIPVTFTDGQISSAINSTISFKTSNETYLLYKDGSKITANSTEEADLELVFVPKTKYTPISEELLSDNIATKEYVDSLGGGSNSVIENIKASEGKSAISYDKDIRDRMENGETKYFYLEDYLVVSDDFNYMLFDAGTIIKVSTAVNGGDATTTDVLKSEDEVYELNFVIFGDGTRSYSVHKVEYAQKSDLNNAGPKTHDGEGMIGWFNTAADGENLTENYGVTPDMVRNVNVGEVISWPSRVQTNAYESALCIYKMEYETYVKDFGDYFETIDIKIGKSPDAIYTYIIAEDNVFKNTI